jgi:hypothetical protein
MDIMSAASDTGMDDQLQGIVDAIPELAWSAGPDGAADFFNLQPAPAAVVKALVALEYGGRLQSKTAGA